MTHSLCVILRSDSLCVCDMTHSLVWNRKVHVTWLIFIHTCDMTHSLVWHCKVTHYVYMWHDSFTCVTTQSTCEVTHYLYIWHDVFTCVTCLIHLCDMYVTRSTCDVIHYLSVTWLIHLCGTPHSRVNEACGTPHCEWGVWHASLWMRRVARLCERRVWHAWMTVNDVNDLCGTPHCERDVWHASFTCDSFTCVARLIHFCDKNNLNNFRWEKKIRLL